MLHAPMGASAAVAALMAASLIALVLLPAADTSSLITPRPNIVLIVAGERSVLENIWDQRVVPLPLLSMLCSVSPVVIIIVRSA